MYSIDIDKNMGRYTAFFKELYSHTHTTQHKAVNILEMANRHAVARVVVPRAVELGFLEKVGTTKNTKYKWLKEMPEPRDIRKILDYTISYDPSRKRTPHVKKIVDTPNSLNADVSAVETHLNVYHVQKYNLKVDNAVKKIKKLRTEGHSNTAIGQMFGVTAVVISKKLSRYNIKVKSIVDEGYTPESCQKLKEMGMNNREAGEVFNVTETTIRSMISKLNTVEATEEIKEVSLKKEVQPEVKVIEKIIEVEKIVEVPAQLVSTQGKLVEKKTKLFWGLYTKTEMVRE